MVLIRESQSLRAQVWDPITLDHHVGVLQQVLTVDATEVPFAGIEHDRRDVHRHLVHQARRECLPTHVTRRDTDHPTVGQMSVRLDGLGDTGDEMVRGLPGATPPVCRDGTPRRRVPRPGFPPSRW